MAELSASTAIVDPAIAALEQEITEPAGRARRPRDAAVAAARRALDELRARRAARVGGAAGEQRRRRARAAPAAGAPGVASRAGTTRRSRSATAGLGLPPLGSPERQAHRRRAARARRRRRRARRPARRRERPPARAGQRAARRARPSTRSRAATPRPPEVEVVRTPRAGTAVTHRLLVLVDPRRRGGRVADRRHAGPRQGRAGARGVGGQRPRPGRPCARARAPRRRDDGPPTCSVLRLSALDAWPWPPPGLPPARPSSSCGCSTTPPRAPSSISSATRRGPPTQLRLAEFLELARAVRELLDGRPRARRPRPGAARRGRPSPGIDSADLAARTAIAVGRARGGAQRALLGRRRRRRGAPPCAARRCSAFPARSAATTCRAAPPSCASSTAAPRLADGADGATRASPPCSATASACSRASSSRSARARPLAQRRAAGRRPARRGDLAAARRPRPRGRRPAGDRAAVRRGRRQPAAAAPARRAAAAPAPATAGPACRTAADRRAAGCRSSRSRGRRRRRPARRAAWSTSGPRSSPTATQMTGLSFHVDQPSCARAAGDPARRRRRPRRTSGACPRSRRPCSRRSTSRALRLVDAEALARPDPRRGRAATRALPAGDLPGDRAGGRHRDHRPRAGERLVPAEPIRWARLEPARATRARARARGARPRPAVAARPPVAVRRVDRGQEGGSAVLAELETALAPLTATVRDGPATATLASPTTPCGAARDARRGRRRRP